MTTIVSDTSARERIARIIDPDAWHETLRTDGCGEYWMGRRAKALAKADAILASLPSIQGEWGPISTAPKDGTHFLACSDGYSQHWGFDQSPPMVVHWWDNPGEEGFYLSSGATGLDDQPVAVKNWRPLPAPPAMLSATPSFDGERGK